MITFVILHYLNEEVTSNCITLLLNQSTNINYKIVVVDNFSNNNSMKNLMKKWQYNDRIYFIECRKNFGFAEGNNAGYIYSKEYLHADAIVIMNNDVLIYDSSFVDKVNNLKWLDEFEIIAPDIITKDGIHQNPFRLKSFSNIKLIKHIIIKVLLRIIYKIPIINRIKSKHSNLKSKNKNLRKKINEKNNVTMIVPHGACIIFTKRWISKENLAFCPYTFLYGEEDILYEYMDNKNYKSIFVPEINVTHLEDVSTDTLLRTDIKKINFFMKHSLKSSFTLLRMRCYNLLNKPIRYKKRYFDYYI